MMRHFLKLKTAGVFLTALISFSAGPLRSSLADDKMAGFYAGPLSAATKTVIEKVKPVVEVYLEETGKTYEGNQAGPEEGALSATENEHIIVENAAEENSDV